MREQILQTVAVILKRGEVDVKGASRDNMFQDVTNLVSSGNVTMVRKKFEKTVTTVHTTHS